MVPMKDLLSGKLQEASDKPDNAIRDDDFVEQHGSLDNAPVQVFKLFHAAPKRQASLNTVVSGLRSDHVAICAYNITDKLRGPGREIDIQGQHLEGNMSAVKVLSLDNFITYGALDLKKEMGACGGTAEVRYSFRGVALPSLAHEHEACKVLTELVNSGAYPPILNTFHVTDETTDVQMQALNEFEKAGLATELRILEWQLTQRGTECLQWERRLTDFKKFFVPRSVPIKDWTTWELQNHLEENKWRMMPFVKRKTPPPLCIKDKLSAEDKVFYCYGNRFELNRTYLECLATVPQLRAKGIESIKHKESKTYYDMLLGRYSDKGNAIMDEGVIKHFKLVDAQKAVPHLVRPLPKALTDDIEFEEAVQLALEDGEPSTEEEVEADGLQKFSDVTTWHPFVFRNYRKQAGGGAFVWKVECECPYHKDVHDHPNTKCKRTWTFSNEHEREVGIKRLKHWCILGRTCPNRAATPEGHRFVRQEECLALLDDQLDRLKAFGLRQVSWAVDKYEVGAAAAPAGVEPRAKKRAGAKAGPKSKSCKKSRGNDGSSTSSDY